MLWLENKMNKLIVAVCIYGISILGCAPQTYQFKPELEMSVQNILSIPSDRQQYSVTAPGKIKINIVFFNNLKNFLLY
jgi:hypothetical protein